MIKLSRDEILKLGCFGHFYSDKAKECKVCRDREVCIGKTAEFLRERQRLEANSTK